MTETRTHYYDSGPDTQLPVRWDADAEAFVTTEQCPECGTLFEVFNE